MNASFLLTQSDKDTEDHSTLPSRRILLAASVSLLKK